MKIQFIKIFIIIVAMLLIIIDQSFASGWPRTGLGFRGTYWDVVNDVQRVRVYDHWTSSDVDVGGYGGGIFFFTQIRKQLFIEFTLGAIGSVHNRVRYWDSEEVNAVAVVPILFGVRYELLPEHIKSNLRPYASVGIGPYWVNDVMVYDDTWDGEEVIVDASARPGAYAGAGMNFMLTKSFAINYDMRYHMVDFQDDRYNSGFEFGIGFTIIWGGNNSMKSVKTVKIKNRN